MSAVFNERKVRKIELVSLTKLWQDICFLQLHCRGTYWHSAPNIYTGRDLKGLDYHSTNTFFHISLHFMVGWLAFRILLRLNREKKSLQEPCIFLAHLITLMQSVIHQCHSLASPHWHCTFLLLCSLCLLISQDWCLLSIWFMKLWKEIKGAGTVRISLHHVRPLLFFFFSFFTASTAAPFLQQRCRMPEVMCISSDTLRGSPSSSWEGGELFCR